MAKLWIWIRRLFSSANKLDKPEKMIVSKIGRIIDFMIIANIAI
jgi:hypothetical protein